MVLDTSIKIKKKWSLENKLLLLGLVFQDAGTFSILPLNLFQFIIMGIGIVCLVKTLVYKTKWTISPKLLLMFFYIFLITFILNIRVFDIESVKSTGMFIIIYFIMDYYVIRQKSFLNIIEVLYTAAFIISLIGCIQQLGYISGVNSLYDYTLYGFVRNGAYINGDLLRVTSLYAEPAHLNSLLSGGIYIALLSINKKYDFVNSFKTAIIIICTLMTFSSLVYISVGIVFVAYILWINQNIMEKLKWVIIGVTLLLIITRLFPDNTQQILDKISTVRTAKSTSSDDLSGFAIISNIKVAISKMQDWYLFGTGLDSHRLFYFEYIGRIYNSVLMYLNYADAASLYTRIFSEFGIFGFIFFMGWIIKNISIATKSKNEYYQFSILLLIIQGLRNGNYIYIITVLCVCSIIYFRKYSYVLYNLDSKYKNEKCVRPNGEVSALQKRSTGHSAESNLRLPDYH